MISLPPLQGCLPLEFGRLHSGSGVAFSACQAHAFLPYSCLVEFRRGNFCSRAKQNGKLQSSFALPSKTRRPMQRDSLPYCSSS
jgi:hypothetical protein